MSKDVFFVVSTSGDGAYVARALGHPVEARAQSAVDLRHQAQSALVAHLGPTGWGHRITLVRTQQARRAARPA